MQNMSLFIKAMLTLLLLLILTSTAAARPPLASDADASISFGKIISENADQDADGRSAIDTGSDNLLNDYGMTARYGPDIADGNTMALHRVFLADVEVSSMNKMLMTACNPNPSLFSDLAVISSDLLYDAGNGATSTPQDSWSRFVCEDSNFIIGGDGNHAESDVLSLYNSDGLDCIVTTIRRIDIGDVHGNLPIIDVNSAGENNDYDVGVRPRYNLRC